MLYTVHPALSALLIAAVTPDFSSINACLNMSSAVNSFFASGSGSVSPSVSDPAVSPSVASFSVPSCSP